MLTPNCVADLIIETITQNKNKNRRVININKKSLSSKGDLSFQTGLDFWRGYVDPNSDLFKKSNNILQYFYRTNTVDQVDKSENETYISNLLIRAVNEKLKNVCSFENLQVNMSLSKNFVIVNLERPIVACLVIKAALQRNDYGRTKNVIRRFNLAVEEDCESEITNLRLKLQKEVCEKLLKYQGHKIEKLDCHDYLFTTKSEGKRNDSENRYLCGVVLNHHKKKEKDLTEDTYFQRKLEKIKELNSQRCCNDIEDTRMEDDFHKIARASVAHELLSTKHTSPVFLESSEDEVKSIKEASFILYNNVRIKAILKKFTYLMREKKFPVIAAIEDMESFDNTMNEESWSLVYNYVMKFPDILESVVSVEPALEINIHVLWSFISHLCHDFSRYYRRTRVLLGGSDLNDQMIKMVTERLYTLKALKVVLHNSLSLLGVEEVDHM